MEKKWIKTEQMLEVLKGEPDVEQQYWSIRQRERKLVIPQIGLTIRGIQNLSSWKFMLVNGGCERFKVWRIMSGTM